MKFRTIFFEILNTLAYIQNFENEVAKLLISELNLKTNVDELANKIKEEWNNRYNTLITKGTYRSIRQLAREVVSSIVKQYSLSLSPQELDYFGNAISSIIVELAELYDDVLQTIDQLEKSNIQMYILTNLDNDIVKKILLKYNLLRYFKGVISSDLTGVGKPATKIFQAALTRAKTTKTNSLLVSGLVEDIVGAKLFGIKIAYIDRLGKKPTVEPDFTITKLSELISIIS